MKRLVLILFGFISTLSSYSQNKLFEIERNVSEYYVDTIYSQINFQFSNTSESTLVLWIDKDRVDLLTDKAKIENHFFSLKGDWTLMQLLLDGNVSNFVPELFDSFMKIIMPKEQFTVSILQKGMANPGLINSLEKHIVIVKADDIKGLKIDNNIEMFNFKSNNVIVFDDWIK